jgi:hypothetical protein
VIHLEQGQLIPQARFALAERIDPTTNRRYALTNIEVEPFDKRGIDRPATLRQDLLHRLNCPEDDAVTDAPQASTPRRLDHLCVEERRQRHPPRLRSWSCGLATLGVHPLAKMRQ